MKTKMKFFFNSIGFQSRFGFWIQRTAFGEDMPPKTSFATDLTFRERTLEEEFPSLAPLMTLEKSEAQEIMDELWRVGLRPTGQADEAAVLPTISKHLADMRAIASHYLGVQLP